MQNEVIYYIHIWVAELFNSRFSDFPSVTQATYGFCKKNIQDRNYSSFIYGLKTMY